jgi:hypothetical protein
MAKKHKPKMGLHHGWVYPRSSDVLQECNMATILHYINVRRAMDMWWTGQSMRCAGRVNGGGGCHRDSGGGNRRCAGTTKMRTEAMNNGTLVGLNDGSRTGPSKWQQRFYRECGENTWVPHRGQLCRPLVASVPVPLFTSYKREASLVCGKCGIPPGESRDPPRRIPTAQGGGDKSGDLVVLSIDD